MPVPLKLKYFARSRMWADVVKTEGQRVFVPSTGHYALGDRVSLDIEAPELEKPITVSGLVVDLQPLEGTRPAGIFVALEQASLLRCRAAVGADTNEAARIAGRAAARVDCHLPARLTAPKVVDGCTVKTLSDGGVTMKTPTPLAVDETVTVNATLPDGTEVTFTGQVRWVQAELLLSGLQFTTIDDATLARVKSATKELSEARGTSGARESRTLVVADDDPGIRDFVSRVITKAGHRVVRAERGDQALELVRVERPVMVFLDVLMPGLDGLEVCKALRADATLARTPVVLMSAMGEDRLASAAQEAGANDYLVKPMRLEQVRAVLSKYVK